MVASLRWNGWLLCCKGERDRDTWSLVECLILVSYLITSFAHCYTARFHHFLFVFSIYLLLFLSNPAPQHRFLNSMGFSSLSLQRMLGFGGFETFIKQSCILESLIFFSPIPTDFCEGGIALCDYFPSPAVLPLELLYSFIEILIFIFF